MGRLGASTFGDTTGRLGTQQSTFRDITGHIGTQQIAENTTGRKGTQHNLILVLSWCFDLNWIGSIVFWTFYESFHLNGIYNFFGLYESFHNNRIYNSF